MEQKNLSWPQVWLKALIRPDQIAPRSVLSPAFGWMLVSLAVLAVLQWTVFDLQLPQDDYFSDLGRWLVLPLVILGGVLLFGLVTGLAHIIATVFGGTGTYADLAYVFAAFLAPMLLFANGLFLLPPFALILIPYGLVLMVLALKGVHHLSWKKSVLAAFWTTLLSVLIVGVLAVFITLIVMVIDRGITNTLRGVVRAASPIVIAAQGELITERSGVTNLALDGMIMLSAMTAHSIVLDSGNFFFAIAAAMLVGAAISFIVVFSSIALRLNQVAVGFVLTILAADVAVFLGKPHYLETGKSIPQMPIPLLEDLPFLGPVLFRHNILIYISILLPVLVWFYIYRTRPGLTLRSIGEQPEAAFARGTRVQFWRYFYTMLGGSLVGLAGATYSLSVKLGWREDLRGEGWIALAIVIFGLWLPGRIALGAYLIVGLRTIAIDLQSSEAIDIPAQIVNMLPWFLMIFTLMFATSGVLQNIVRFTPERFRPTVRRFLRAAPPHALGTTFEKH